MPRRRRTEDANMDSYLHEKQELRSTLDRFADDTSMLGFRYLHTRYKTWFRFVWALVLFFFLGLTVYQVCERVAYYFIRNPLTTRRSYDTPQMMKFPTIGICNKMQIRVSSIVERKPELVKAICNVYDSDGQISQNISVLESLKEFDNTDLLDVYRTAHQTVDDFFVSCELGKSGSCQDDIKPIFTADGLCFAVTPNVTVRRPGPETTLSLLLNLEVYETIPGMVIDPGVTLSIYEEGQRITDYAQGIHLEAGKIVTIPINEVRKLSRYEQHCGKRDIGPFDLHEYSLAACKWANTVERIEGECGCSPVLSPYHRNYMVGEGKMNKTKRGKRRRPVCTFYQEMGCVSRVMSSESEDVSLAQQCPEDCTDVTYSSVVFGGKLVPSEILTMLPSDWEDLKEKRLTEFQKALEVIPNERIPVVRAVQSLAIEAQNFFHLATELFDVQTDEFRTPCFISSVIRSSEYSLMKYRSTESIWERVTTYVTRSLSRELNSTARTIGFIMDKDGNIQEHQGFIANYSMIALSLLQLGSTEAHLSHPAHTFGLKQMEESVRKTVISYVLPFIRELKSCVMKLHDTSENSELTSGECRKIFKRYYGVLLDAQTVYHMANRNSLAYQAYEDVMKKVQSALRNVYSTNRIKVLDWHNHQINIKQFENLYREGGHDNVEIVELMKLRKPMTSDIIDAINEVIKELHHGLDARNRFLNKMQINDDGDSAAGILTTIRCLQNITERIPLLKKSSFLRGEWLSRVHRQVQIAQSYSPSPQYDQVNLLHVKLYFAHFKQETIIQERSYNMFLLLAEIGGTIGLYVGATLLTVAETIVFFFERRTRLTFIKPAHI
ncbi:unnamed protein product [Auanema sp. JU1783]|nr:unnamed protein product [Auanema sp. JU1783]